MKRTFEFKNDNYVIYGYTLNEEESKKYKTDIIFGEEDDLKWVLNINGKDIAFYNTGNNIIDSDQAIIVDDELYIVTDFDYYKIDLINFKCLAHIEIDDVTCNILKYQNGFLIHCDLDLLYVENDKIKWSYSAPDILDKITILEDGFIEVMQFDYDKYKKYYLDKAGKICVK